MTRTQERRARRLIRSRWRGGRKGFERFEATYKRYGYSRPSRGNLKPQFCPCHGDIV